MFQCLTVNCLIHKHCCCLNTEQTDHRADLATKDRDRASVRFSEYEGVTVVSVSIGQFSPHININKVVIWVQ